MNIRRRRGAARPGSVFVLLMLLAMLGAVAGSRGENASDSGPPGTDAGRRAAAEPLVIRADTVLDPSRRYGPIVVAASDITIDGRGAWLVGDSEAAPNQRRGTAISAEGVSGVTLRNLRAKGWETGLRIVDAERWRVENCDFSDNFHDPEFGWGENGRRGGIVLQRVRRSVLRGNRANRVWDACVLVESDDNVIEENDFSRASNTCLKLWTSCRNRVAKNNLSYGLRVAPGEVHARDSTSVLLESGSNDNLFADNDCTHGGDGIFIRVLNGWVSSGNRFERNDCSYANNNGFEAWSPRNTYIGNRANYCSYGFWLGASDQTVLLGNEASFNGLPEGFHNSPHLPDAGHAGIVFMFGPSSHTICRGNRCVGNHGAGIALVGDEETAGRRFKAFHWIIEQNILRDNRWGIYARQADWVRVAANEFSGNTAGDLSVDDTVTRLIRPADRPAITRPPTARLAGPALGQVGAVLRFDASTSSDPAGLPLGFGWDLGDGTTAAAPAVEHVFRAPGFYRLGLTVDNGLLADLAWRDLYVVEPGECPATEGGSAEWTVAEDDSKATARDDADVRLWGRTSAHVLVAPYGGGRASLLWPATKRAALPLAGKRRLTFWLKAINENVPAWQGPQPVVTLYQSDQRRVVLTPKDDLMSSPADNEQREGWRYFDIPLAGDERWTREGEAIERVEWLTLGFDSWGAPPLRFWIDVLAFR